VRRYHLNEGGARDRAERPHRDALGTEPHRVAVYCAPAGMALKEADVPVIVAAPGRRLGDDAALSVEQRRDPGAQAPAPGALEALRLPLAALGARLAEAGRVCEQAIGFAKRTAGGTERAGTKLTVVSCR